MRIAEINMVHVGSTGKIMLQIAEEARQAGHEVWTFSPYNYFRIKKENNPPIEHHTYFGHRAENMFHFYFAKYTGFQGFLSRIGTRRLIKSLKKIQPDIVHLHNLHNQSTCLPMLFRYLKKQKIKVVWTLHDCWTFTGLCPHFDMIKCDKWKQGCHHCPQVKGWRVIKDRTKFMWRVKKRWFTGVSDMTIVTPSVWLQDLVKQSYLKEFPIQVINNGIDLNVFRYTASEFRAQHNLENKIILLGVSFSWGMQKGLDVFVRLSKKLGEDYQIVLVGTNEIVDKQLPSNIISIHRTENQQQLAALYSAADLFVNPTREDTYPTVNMEAIACGTPVLTFRTGGSPEILNQKTGVVVERDDFEALTAEIKKICENKPFRQDDCLQQARVFDKNEKYREYVALYSSIMRHGKE